MPNKSNPFIFIGIFTIISSLILSTAATQLKPFQNTNIDVDKKNEHLQKNHLYYYLIFHL